MILLFTRRYPRWSRDGQQILYVQREKGLARQSIQMDTVSGRQTDL